MEIICAGSLTVLELGKRGSNQTRAIRFDIAEWMADYPDGSVHILHKRPGEETPLPVSNTEKTDTYIDWVIEQADVANEGYGECELVMMDTISHTAKSVTYMTHIGTPISSSDETVPEPHQGWVDSVLQAATDAEAAKNAAVDAQTAAEMAQSAAEAAQTAAEKAQDTAENAKASAVMSSNAAYNYAADANRAKRDSVNAKNDAVQAKIDAENAQEAAENAEESANTSALKSEGYAVGTQNGTPAGSGEPYYQDNAKYYKEQAAAAKTAAETARDTAQQTVAGIEAAGTAQVGRVAAEGATQVTNVQTKGQQVLDSIPSDYSQLSGNVDELKSAFDVYGAVNRILNIDGTYYPGSLTLVYNGESITVSGSPTGTGYTHSNRFNSDAGFPDGITAGMTLQITQVCNNNNIRFRFIEYVNGSASMIADIPGNGTAQVNISSNATGCIIRTSIANGQTYNNVITKQYILVTLTKQQIQEQITSNEQEINTVDGKLTAIKAYMPTAGSTQFINVENAQIINARVSSNNKLISDANYSAIIVPANIEAQKTYWAKVFSNNVTLAEIKLYTFNTVEVGTSIVVDVSNSYSATNKKSRTQTTATASYFVLVLYITTGTVADALNSAVIALSNDAPTEYTPYYVSVDEAISDAVGKKTSPDCVEVGTSADDYVYIDVNTAVSGNPGRIIKINYGTYETEVEDLTTDKKIIGTDVDFCVLEKTGGDYDHPPIEVAGGIIKNLTVKMVNNTEAQQFGYCVHSDNSATANKTLLISNCKFDNDLYRVIGMGVRGGETVIFENCEFVGHGETAGQSIYIHNSSGTKATVCFRNCYFKAVNECLLLQAWGSDCSVDWEFIDCTCISENYGVGIETVWTDYVSGSTHDTSRLHEFSGKFALLPTSHGNNISVLNAD